MRIFRPGFLGSCLYPGALFRIETTEKILYLTFDDGPDPLSTLQLLRILQTYRIPAVFFCKGLEGERYFELVNQIRSKGHIIGNHGYNHLDGWRTDAVSYAYDVMMASEFTSDKIFRPPFGKLTPKQLKLLSSYKIILWDLMVYDFDVTFGSERSLQVLKTRMRPGSIIVLHDTVTSCANTILEDFIIFALKEGYRFELINVSV